MRFAPLAALAASIGLGSHVAIDAPLSALAIPQDALSRIPTGTRRGPRGKSRSGPTRTERLAARKAQRSARAKQRVAHR